MIRSLDSASGGSDRRGIPGEAGIWVFIFGDLLAFAAFFIAYLLARVDQLDVFRESQAELVRMLGLANTLLLLSSSWCMAQAVAAVRRRDAKARALLLATILCGLLFLGIKGVEYGLKIGDGFTLNTNMFFTYYYMLTAIHGMHVVIGITILTVTLFRFDDRGQFRSSVASIETVGAFWHLVDLLWVILFPLLYLV